MEYFIKLKPLNPFYFGSTKSFDDNRVNENYKKPYFLKGNLYPQQTAILGMLRKKILEDNGILVENVKRNNEQKNNRKLKPKDMKLITSFGLFYYLALTAFA